MTVSFENIIIGQTYTRNELAQIWGYTSYAAIARGVVTPRNSNFIILFVTREKQSSATQYRDRIETNKLYWEGPEDHFAENRIMKSGNNCDEIHLFFRERHHSDFVYFGEIRLIRYYLHSDKPSEFEFQLL